MMTPSWTMHCALLAFSPLKPTWTRTGIRLHWILLSPAEVVISLWVNARFWPLREQSYVVANCWFWTKVCACSLVVNPVFSLTRYMSATSAIDYQTDNVIQNSLRSKLGKDVTLLTVAHRLQTIMDSDRIVRCPLRWLENVMAYKFFYLLDGIG